MRRSLLGSLVLAVCAFPVVAGSLELPGNSRSQPMHFSRQQEGPASECGAHCRRLIFASGMITADTPRRFEVFTRAHDIDGATVVLDSDGGSVRGALAFGRLIRSYNLSTTVGRRVDGAAIGGADETAAIAPTHCESMCAYVLLAGVRRAVPPKSRVLVHQIWLGDRRDDAVAADYSAEDLSLVQRDIGQIVRYTADMGGSAELVELSLRIPPWEPMRALARDELQRMRLDLSAEQDDPPATAAVAAAAPVSYAPAAEPVALASERGWSVVEEKGEPAYLARRHPLTHEGERIGSFDLLLGCTAQPGGTFSLTYIERRGPLPASRQARVEQVRMWFGDSEIPFRLVSSGSPVSREIETVATAAIPPNLVHAFGSTDRLSLSMLTRSAGQPATWIRIGNSGFSQSLPQFEARCSQERPSLDAHARLEAR